MISHKMAYTEDPTMNAELTYILRLLYYYFSANDQLI